MKPSSTECAGEVTPESQTRSNQETAPVAPSAVTAPSRRLALLFALLCLLGVAVSIELTRIHLFVHTDPNYHSVCAMSEGVNCETVAVSPYSVFAGLPVSLWGLAAYLIMGALSLWAWSRRRLHPTWPWGILLLLSAFSVAVSVVLAFISATRIDSLCLFCMSSYAINAGLLIVSCIALKRSQKRALAPLALDVKALLCRPLLVVLLAVVGLIGIVLLQVFVPRYWKTPGWADLPRLASGTDENGRHWIGARSPGLTIVEFSDYQCPHCRAAHKDMRVFLARHLNQIRLIHQHLPLDMACNPGLRAPFHTHACLFAEAAECAGLQGRFWEMNDAIFSIQETVKTNNVDPVKLAVRLGLNRSEFKRCLDRHVTAGRVAKDVQEAMARKLTGTPSFLVGEQVFLGRIPEADLQRWLSGKP
jgi:uncharacterized membrane protein/predicted DsbA family dithiol-disulfide isomerase